MKQILSRRKQALVWRVLRPNLLLPFFYSLTRYLHLCVSVLEFSNPFLSEFSSRFVSIASDHSRQGDIFRHQSDPFGVCSTHHRIFEQVAHVGLCGFLNRKNTLRLEAHVWIARASYLTNQLLKGVLGQQKRIRILEFHYFAQGVSSRSHTRFL